MEGLEISEVYLSELERTKRIDSDFYKLENLEFIDQLAEHNPKALTEFVNVSDGNHLSISDYFTDEGVPYYRGGDIYNFYIEQTSDSLKIPLEIFNTGNMKRSHLKKGDVLISIVGAIIGNLSLVKTDSKATCSCKLAILRPNKIEPELLAVFLKSKYGQNQIQKFRRGTGQTGFILEDFDQLLIPEFSKKLSNNIKHLIDESYFQLELSQQNYSQAETLLLETLGLQNFEPSKESVNIKNLKESFLTSGRLDAEYYQKKYEDIIKFIEQKTNWNFLHELTSYISNGNQPPYSENGEIKFFSQKWIGDKSIDYCFLNNENEPKVDKKFFEEEKNKSSLVHKGDILYYSVGANLGYCHNYLEEENIAVGSFINIIRADKEKVNEIYLGVVLNSMIGRFQGNREKSGMAQPYIYAKNLRDFKIPLLEEKKQESIAELTIRSFQLTNKSSQLLELAKTAVEKAIEENEETAMEFINLEVGKLGIKL